MYKTTYESHNLDINKHRKVIEAQHLIEKKTHSIAAITCDRYRYNIEM
jgi:hypothetical protein